MAAMIASMRFIISAVTVLLGFCLTQAAWAADAFPKEIRIGVQKGDGLVALRLSGNLEKAFAPHHVTVKWIEFVYGAPLVEAINSGDVDVGTVGSTPPILAQAGSAPALVYVAYSPKLRGSYGLIVAKDSSIKSVRDLQGKKVAFAKGSQGHLFALQALTDAGVDPASVHFVYLAYSDARAAFERGDIDAWVVPDPRYADTELHTGARTILKIGDLSIPQYGFYISTRTFASAYPAALRLLFNQLDQQTKYSLAHPNETVDLLSKNTGVSREVWQLALPRLDWGVTYPVGDDVVKAQQKAADLAFRSKLIPRSVDVRQAMVGIR
jgi:sulfonate transport system substrate-binding protein